MGWDKAKGQGEKRDWAREAMIRRRADQWRSFDKTGGFGWDGESIWAAGVWAQCPVLQVYKNCGGRKFLCGGGGDEENLNDEGPSGLLPQAQAHAQAANAHCQPGQVQVYAAHLGNLLPVELVAYARAAEAGLPWGSDATTGDPPKTNGRKLARLLGVTE